MILRNTIVSTLSAAAIFIGCAIDPNAGISASRGPVGSLGAECRCSTGGSDCDGDQGQCQESLVCRRDDSGKQYCTHDCPCPINFICKAAGVPGQRLSCFKQP